MVHVRPPPAPRFLNLEQRRGMAQCRTIASGRGKGIVHIDDADDLRVDWDLVSPEPVRIPGPIVALVVPANDRLDIPGKLDRREKLQTPYRVHLNDAELLRRERPRFVQD